MGREESFIYSDLILIKLYCLLESLRRYAINYIACIVCIYVQLLLLFGTPVCTRRTLYPSVLIEYSEMTNGELSQEYPSIYGAKVLRVEDTVLLKNVSFINAQVSLQWNK